MDLWQRVQASLSIFSPAHEYHSLSQTQDQQHQSQHAQSKRRSFQLRLFLPGCIAALVFLLLWKMFGHHHHEHGPVSTAQILPCDRKVSVDQVRGAKVQMLSWQSSQQTVSMPVYVDERWSTDGDTVHENVEQVVIHTHGQERDAARAWVEISAARQSSSQGAATLLISPLFFNGLDKTKFGWQGRGSTGDVLVWKGNGWGDGSPNQYPDSNPAVSSFEAFDVLIDYFHQHRQNYPRLRRVVISGHSLGGQLVHRYSVLGDPLSRSPNALRDAHFAVDFVVMNPATYLYFTADRPGRNCSDMNEYKYGFDKLQDYLHTYPGIGRNPDRGPRYYLERLLAERKVHFLNGATDRGAGDDRPPAMAQGNTRVERAQSYFAHLERMQANTASVPQWTVDWVSNTGHDGMAMVTSSAGIKRIFGSS